MNQKILWKIESLWKEHFFSHKHLNVKDSELVSDILKKFFFNEKSFNFRLVEAFDTTESNDIVFSDDDGNYRGLKQQQVLQHQGKLVYICDNHNKILTPLYHLRELLHRPLKIIHIDAHPDNAQFLGNKPKSFNQKSLEYLLNETIISDFYDALSETNTIGELIRVTSSSSFDNKHYFSAQKSYDFFSFDIDIFGPEGEFVDREAKIKAISQAWHASSVICIALSPGFIEQDYAQYLTRIFINPL